MWSLVWEQRIQSFSVSAAELKPRTAVTVSGAGHRGCMSLTQHLLESPVASLGPFWFFLSRALLFFQNSSLDGIVHSPAYSARTRRASNPLLSSAGPCLVPPPPGSPPGLHTAFWSLFPSGLALPAPSRPDLLLHTVTPPFPSTCCSFHPPWPPPPFWLL